MNTGFIGLGMMGDPMARNLLHAGHQLSVFDLRPDRVEKCQALGATVVSSVAELAGCDLVFIIVNTADQLKEVLFGAGGLIGNALDAMGDQGQLLLSTRRRLDGLVEVVISDDGPGVPLGIQNVVFELGYTTKADQGGLGLGLWWTRVYVSRLGWQVKIRSFPDRGTVVSIRLPAAQEVES